jgi:hypothetical protein
VVIPGDNFAGASAGVGLAAAVDHAVATVADVADVEAAAAGMVFLSCPPLPTPLLDPSPNTWWNSLWYSRYGLVALLFLCFVFLALSSLTQLLLLLLPAVAAAATAAFPVPAPAPVSQNALNCCL